MNDKELLELAAKAAGMDMTFQSEGSTTGKLWKKNTGKDYAEYVVWNPLIDDGDALRLAVKLNISIMSNSIASWTACGKHQIVASEELHKDSDPYSATRRTIVRAAAEIGRQK